ncbi:MAG: DNA-3-methyladenine glycosylase [Oscillospiraceae bacterium]|nr:DNA-3-methyladenine glycosylase [Oscillospiraceae bacterium]
MKALPREFYDGCTVDIARALLGKKLVRTTDEGVTAGYIVETEAYMGKADPAAHSYKGMSERVRVQYGPQGMSYIYMIYGAHYCFNITTGPIGRPEAVLVRALEPCEGLELMEKRRRTTKLFSLCSGPGKLCKAMDITKAQYGTDLCNIHSGLYICEGIVPEKTVASKRINIDYAGEAKDWLWRFTIDGNPHISVK